MLGTRWGMGMTLQSSSFLTGKVDKTRRQRPLVAWEMWQVVWWYAGPTLRNGDDVSELQVSDGEVHDGGVLLPEEVVLGEALEVQHQVGRQARQAVPAPPVLDVIVHPAPVKLVQQLKDGDLRSSQQQSAPCRRLGTASACLPTCTTSEGQPGY